MSDDEGEEWSALQSAAVALNELFGTLVQAGFTEQQSLRLVAYLILDIQFQESDE